MQVTLGLTSCSLWVASNLSKLMKHSKINAMQGLKEKFCNIYITPVDDIIVARRFCDDNFMFETK